MAEMTGYFSQEKTGIPMPGELILARLLLWGTFVAVALLFGYDMINYPVTAGWLGMAVGVNAHNIAGAVLAVLIRPGRRWVRWVLMLVGAAWILVGIRYVFSDGVTYLAQFLLPLLLLTAVNLPAARRYFAAMVRD